MCVVFAAIFPFLLQLIAPLPLHIFLELGHQLVEMVKGAFAGSAHALDFDSLVREHKATPAGTYGARKASAVNSFHGPSIGFPLKRPRLFSTDFLLSSFLSSPFSSPRNAPLHKTVSISRLWFYRSVVFVLAGVLNGSNLKFTLSLIASNSWRTTSIWEHIVSQRWRATITMCVSLMNVTRIAAASFPLSCTE